MVWHVHIILIPVFCCYAARSYPARSYMPNAKCLITGNSSYEGIYLTYQIIPSTVL